MVRIGLEEFELLVSEGTDRFWQCVIGSPEAWYCVVLQSFRERPARWSAKAVSASPSSLPAFTSWSICSSLAVTPDR